MIEYSFRVQDAEVFQLIRQIRDRGDDMTPVMRRIAGIMHDEVEENFAAEGRPKWPALAEATIAQKARLGFSPLMLERTGELKSWITKRANATQAITGSNLKYSVWQFLGTRHIPARNPLTLRSSTVGIIKMKLMTFLISKQWDWEV